MRSAISIGSFQPEAFLASVGDGRRMLKCQQGEVIFSQGDSADALFFLRRGKVKITTLSSQGRKQWWPSWEAEIFSGRDVSLISRSESRRLRLSTAA